MSAYAQEYQENNSEIIREETLEISSGSNQMLIRYNANYWRQFSNLIWRSFLTNGRDPTLTRTRVIQSIVSKVNLIYLANIIRKFSLIRFSL